VVALVELVYCINFHLQCDGLLGNALDSHDLRSTATLAAALDAGGERAADLLRVVLQLDGFRLLGDGIDGEDGGFGHAGGSGGWGHVELSPR